MSFNFKIQKFDGSLLEINIAIGGSLFVLGANGSGKSSIMNLFSAIYPEQSRRISAHRQNWFSSGSITLSPAQKKDIDINIKHNDTSPQARWKDDYSTYRASIAIYDLINSENKRARLIAGAVDSNNIDEAKSLSIKDSSIKTINELLKLANISIEVFIENNEDLMASRNGGKGTVLQNSPMEKRMHC
jgi:energy-coupling factor transporter ATP-binding protein EcfA2